MGKFETTYEEMLEMVSTGGVWGDSSNIGTKGGSFGNNDFYATGDARVPKVIGAKEKRNKKGKKCKQTIPILRRAVQNGM